MVLNISICGCGVWLDMKIFMFLLCCCLLGLYLRILLWFIVSRFCVLLIIVVLVCVEFSEFVMGFFVLGWIISW